LYFFVFFPQIALAYLALVYLGQKLMRSQKPFDGPRTSGVLAAWNFGFSLFSGWA
jgi:hypothetical protein